MAREVLKYDEDLPEKVGDRDSRDFAYITPISVHAKVTSSRGYGSRKIPVKIYEALAEECDRQIYLKLEKGDFRRAFPWGKGFDINVFSDFSVDVVPKISEKGGRYFLTLDGTAVGKGYVLKSDLKNHSVGISKEDAKISRTARKKHQVVKDVCSRVLSCEALDDLFEDDPDALGLIAQAEQLSREDQTLIFRGEHSKAKFFDNQRRNYSRRVSGQD